MLELFWTAPLVCFAAALLTALLFVPRSVRHWAVALPAILALLWCAALAFSAWFGFETPQNARTEWLRIGNWALYLGAHLDGLTALMLVVVSTVTLMVMVYSIGYMGEDPGIARYFATMALFAGAMLGLVIADNLFLLYMCWELVGLCSYLLIGFWYRKPAAANAAKKAFVVTRFGDVGFLLGMILVSAAAGTFQIDVIRQKVADGTLAPLFGSLPEFCGLIALLIFCGAVGKSAQFPLHIWLPDAMEGPTPVSALIHAATMVAAGVFLVARMFFLFEQSAYAMQWVAWIGAITAFMAATIALVQNDIKRVMAYSTISQLGFMMLALGVGNKVAAMFHLGTHAYFKSLLFLTAGSVIHATHTQDLREMGGLYGKMKVTALAAGIGALALAGIAPFSGFFSKDQILVAAWHTELPAGKALFLIAILTVILTAFYMTRMWLLAFGGTARTETANHAHESPPVMTVPLVLLAAAAVVAGAAAPGVARAMGGTEWHGWSEYLNPVAIVALAFSIIGIWIGFRLYNVFDARKGDRLKRFVPRDVYWFLEKKWLVDAFFESVVAQFTLVFARFIAWIDRHVVDGAVNGVAYLNDRAGAGFCLLTNGQAQYYALIAIAGAMALAAAALVVF